MGNVVPVTNGPVTASINGPPPTLSAPDLSGLQASYNASNVNTPTILAGYQQALQNYNAALSIYNSIRTDPTINWNIPNCGADPGVSTTASGAGCQVDNAAITYCTCCVQLLQATINEDTVKYQAYTTILQAYNTINNAWSNASGTGLLDAQKTLLVAGQSLSGSKIWNTWQNNGTVFDCSTIGTYTGALGIMEDCDSIGGAADTYHGEWQACTACGYTYCGCSGLAASTQNDCKQTCSGTSPFRYNSNQQQSTYYTTYQTFLTTYAAPAVPTPYAREASYPNVMCQACTQCTNLSNISAGGNLTVSDINSAQNCVANMQNATVQTPSSSPTVQTPSNSPTVQTPATSQPIIPPPSVVTPFYKSTVFIVMILVFILFSIIGFIVAIIFLNSGEDVPTNDKTEI